MLDHQILACQALRHRCDAAMGKVCAADLGNRMLGPQLAVNLFQGIKCHRKTGCRIFRLDHQMIRFLDLLFFLFRFEIPVFHYGFLFLFKFMNRSFLTLFLCLCRFQVAEIPENTCLPFRCALFLIVRLDLGHFFCQRFFRLCFMKACYYILVQRRLFYFLVRRFCLSFRFSSLLFWLCLLFGFGFTEILSVIFIVWEDFFVSIYTTSAAVAAYGIIRMDRVCALEGLTATYEVASSCLRGTGKSLEPSVITILGRIPPDLAHNDIPHVHDL